jgi:hypothetical protein
MNCSLCGSPLLFDRVVFRCQCGGYVHAYCADKHILTSHRPEMEEGSADLNGDFHLKYQPKAELVAVVEAITGPAVESPEDEGADEELLPGEEIAGHTEEELGDESSDEANDEASDGDR